MATVTLRNGRLVVSADKSQSQLTKNIFGARWHKEKSVWSYPLTSYDAIVHAFGKDLVVGPGVSDAVGRFRKNHAYIKRLKSGDAEPRPHQFLMKHQRLCRDISVMADRYAFFLDTGTGKTLLGLQIIEDNPNMKWAVVCPKSIIKAAWMEDQKNFYPHIKLMPLSKNITKDDYLELAKSWGVDAKERDNIKSVIKRLAVHAQAFIVNFESFKTMTDFLLEQGVSGLVFDESVKLKDGSSDITRTTLSFGEKMDKAYLLSGKPAPNTPLEYFSQMKLVDTGVFGESFFQFRARYFEPFGYMGYNWRMRSDQEKQFGERLNLRSIFIEKSDCMDLPEKTYLTRHVELTGDAFKYYKQMEKERFLEIQQSRASAPNILANLMKLRQITSGFVIDSEDTAVPIHRQKMDELLDTLEEIGTQPVIIWGNFKNEIRTIEQELKKHGKRVVTAYSGTRDVDESIRQFKSGEAQYIVAHPQTLKYGVTFVHCTYAIYYSMSYSFDDYYQSHDRIYRKGQTQPCTFIFLICPHTVDVAIKQAIESKRSLAEVIQNYAKGVN